MRKGTSGGKGQKFVAFALRGLSRCNRFLLYLVLAGIFWLVFYAVYDFWMLDWEVRQSERAVALARADDEVAWRDGMVAWLRIDDTTIDYPVMQATDNDYYLTHDYLGNYAVAGSVFLDYRNSAEDAYWIIYGHHMSQGRMFSEIERFAEEDFLAEHRSGELSMPDGRYGIEVLGFARIATDDDWYMLQKHSKMSVEENLAQLRSDVGVNGDKYEKIVMLSTCDRESRSYRDVLFVGLKEAT